MPPPVAPYGTPLVITTDNRNLDGRVHMLHVMHPALYHDIACNMLGMAHGDIPESQREEPYAEPKEMLLDSGIHSTPPPDVSLHDLGRSAVSDHIEQVVSKAVDRLLPFVREPDLPKAAEIMVGSFRDIEQSIPEIHKLVSLFTYILEKGATKS